jgi:tRNA threonylcarbamoyladenosine biosynthesis protein TsaB
MIRSIVAVCRVPRILAIETSSSRGSLALREAGGACRGRILAEPRRQAEVLLAEVDALLAGAGVTLRELDAIAFGAGPGSFTGVRLAASVAQGLGLALGVPLLPVGSLEVLAAGVEGDADVAVAVDGRMDDVYFARYRTRAGVPHVLETPRLVRPAERAALAARVAGHVGCGDGWRLAGMPGAVLAACDATAVPAADILLALGEAMHAAGLGVPPAAVALEYLRPASAWGTA